MLIGALGTFFIASSHVPRELYYLGIAISGPAAFSGSLGIAVCCTVPSDEFSIDEYLSSHKVAEKIISFVLAFLVLAFSSFFFVVPPYIGAIFYVFSIWFATHPFRESIYFFKGEFTTKINFLLALGIVTPSALLLCAALGPIWYICHIFYIHTLRYLYLFVSN
jgi:hypothetical protein